MFEPSNEHVARIIVGILKERGCASYQIGCPRNKIFITIETKKGADEIARIIGKFMEKTLLKMKMKAYMFLSF